MRAADLARQLLAYAGGGRYVVEPIDFAALVRDSLPRLARLLPPAARFEVDVPETLPGLTGDASQLRQVLANLVSNAGESLRESRGVVHLRVRPVVVDRTWLAHAQVGASNSEGRYLLVEVADDGAGMSAETLARVFDPFFSTKFTGRGLGLPAVLGIVRGHGGAIRIDSEPGHGTSVKVLLAPVPPRVQRRGPRVTARPAGEAPAAPLVLVADDEPTVLEVVAKTLERGGFVVERAASGREVVDRFHERADEVAAVLLDIRMPELDGRNALREMRQRRPDLPALYMSGYGQADKEAGFDPGEVDAFIQKPFSPSALVEEVRRVIAAGRRATSQAVADRATSDGP
jgi:CheY-like chemotaxis protein